MLLLAPPASPSSLFRSEDQQQCVQQSNEKFTSRRRQRWRSHKPTTIGYALRLSTPTASSVPRPLVVCVCYTRTAVHNDDRRPNTSLASNACFDVITQPTGQYVLPSTWEQLIWTFRCSDETMWTFRRFYETPIWAFQWNSHNRSADYIYSLYIIYYFYFPAQLTGGFTFSPLLDKSWSGCVLTPCEHIGTIGTERGYSWSFVWFHLVFGCLCPFQLQKKKLE